MSVLLSVLPSLLPLLPPLTLQPVPACNCSPPSLGNSVCVAGGTRRGAGIPFLFGAPFPGCTSPGGHRGQGGGGERLVTCGGPGGLSLEVLGVAGVGFFLVGGFQGGLTPFLRHWRKAPLPL